MNRKQFFILLGLVLVVGAAGLLVHSSSNDSWHSGGAAIGQKLLPNLPVNDVAQITIKSGADEAAPWRKREQSLARARARGIIRRIFRRSANCC